MLGVLFHTVLVISPAIAVFDLSITVYTMLFLFMPSNFPEKLRSKIKALRG